MAVRQDWIRLTQRIHSITLAFHHGRRNSSDVHCEIAATSLQPLVIERRVPRDRRLTTENERMKSLAILNSVKNQIR
ncbi:MAG TPA: hypothetical protein VFE96_05670 [Candidatus Bathyarchaeia archaeon]|nr:hypothetical protein [Candidatus Bathyarchaeia archaeon]